MFQWGDTRRFALEERVEGLVGREEVVVAVDDVGRERHRGY